MAITCSIVISEPMQQPVMTCAALRSHGGIGGTSFVSLSSAVAISEKVIVPAGIPVRRPISPAVSAAASTGKKRQREA